MFGSCHCNLYYGGADCHFELGNCPGSNLSWVSHCGKQGVSHNNKNAGQYENAAKKEFGN